VDAPALRTERLVLLPLGAADIDEIAAMYADAEVMRHVADGVRSRAETTAALGASENCWRSNGWGLWAIRDAATGGLLGEGGLRPTAVIEGAAADFGITLGRRSRGSGLATEAGAAIIDDAWNRYGGDLIHATVLPDDTSNSAVLRRLGFTMTGVRTVQGQPHQIWVMSRKP